MKVKISPENVLANLCTDTYFTSPRSLNFLGYKGETQIVRKKIKILKFFKSIKKSYTKIIILIKN